MNDFIKTFIKVAFLLLCMAISSLLAHYYLYAILSVKNIYESSLLFIFVTIISSAPGFIVAIYLINKKDERT